MTRNQAQAAWLEHSGQKGPWTAVAHPGGAEQLQGKARKGSSKIKEQVPGRSRRKTQPKKNRSGRLGGSDG